MFFCLYLSVLPPMLSLLLLSKVHGAAPISSPPASTELICHTAHASECYPAIFQPTEHFQRIHEDQSIPAGLHVRMNLATGLKEARLNVPEPPRTPHADLVVVDDLPPRPRGEDSVVELPQLLDQSDAGAGYERLEPYHPAAFNTGESSLFSASIASLRSTAVRSTAALSTADLPALSVLQDLAHSVHWGVALARDTTVCQILIAAIDPGSAASTEIRSAATLLLGTAVHSNPDALDALLSRPYSSEAGMTPVLTVLATLKDPEREDITLKTRTVFLLSQLCQNIEQLRSMVHSGGLSTLYDLFEPERMTPNDRKDKLRSKAANLIYDRILSSFSNANGPTPQSDPDVSTWGDDQVFLNGLKPWCNTLTKALKMYEGAGLSRADTVYESIQETNRALEEAHAQLRICANESEL